MKKVGISNEHLPRIKKFAELLENSDSTLNRSNLKSVSSAIIYYYLGVNQKLKDSLNMNKKKFAMLTGLSEITITKLIKIISQITGKEVI